MKLSVADFNSSLERLHWKEQHLRGGSDLWAAGSVAQQLGQLGARSAGQRDLSWISWQGADVPKALWSP